MRSYGLFIVNTNYTDTNARSSIVYLIHLQQKEYESWNNFPHVAFIGMLYLFYFIDTPHILASIPKKINNKTMVSQMISNNNIIIVQGMQNIRQFFQWPSNKIRDEFKLNR